MKNENGRQTMIIIPVKYSSTVRDGQVSATLTSKKRVGGGGGDSSPCAITQHLMCSWMCRCVRVRVHPSACVYELFASPPQALGCWVCSLKRLCFCCHLFLPLSHSRSLSVCSCCVSVSSTISAHLYPIIHVLS